MKCILLLIVIVGISMPVGAQHSDGKVLPPSQSASANAFRVSLSVSPYTELMFISGVVFTDGEVSASSPEQLQQLYMKHGANEVYTRIGTARTYTVGFGDHSLDPGLARARMAQALGLPFNPELGLFNIYGDIRWQASSEF